LFSIKSTLSSRELVFSERFDEYFRADIKGDIATSINVYTYTDESGILRLFSELSSLNKPWQGVRIWESSEDDFSISVSCSPLGQVLIEVYLSKSTASPEELTVKMSLVTEFGQLPKIAQDAKAFFE